MKLIFVIDKIGDGKAALNDGKGRIIYWPQELLPAEAKTGGKITFNIGEDDDLAKNILNEILG